MNDGAATEPVGATVEPAPPAPAKPERLESLDLFRGLTVAGMLLVNNPGDSHTSFAQLEHAEWHGCTFTDLIFPSFLFIVGVSITLSLGKRGAGLRGEGAPLGPILSRAAKLVALGLLLHAIPFTFDRPLRLPGVLQRIGVCYLVAALLAARTTLRTQALVTGGLLAGYYAAQRLIPVPGFGAFAIDVKGQDLGAFIDRTLLPGHLSSSRPDFVTFDPEGLFSTLPAIATTLLGVLAGRWLATARPAHERISGLFFAGFALTVLGLCATVLMPLNKRLWTPSYVLFTGGLALQALSACYWLVDIHGVRRWATPFLAFGRNPIVAFFASSAVARALGNELLYARVGTPTAEVSSLKDWLYAALFLRGGASTVWSSLAYALVYVALWWAVLAVMDRKKIYVKV